MNGNFLVSGMFRSGTTMFARMLHANPNIVCASDPFAPIFKSYRNTIAQDMIQDFDIFSPLNDYYFDKSQNSLFQELQRKNFDVAITEQEIERVKGLIKGHCKLYSPKISLFLDVLEGKNYKQVFDSAFEIIRSSYGKGDNAVVGFKEVWVDEFASHFNEMKKGNKVIHIVRDPRSVVASNFASEARYPLLFLIRQWRKLASIAWLNSRDNENFLLVRFEDLLKEPERVTRVICDFLGVKFHSNMVNPESFKDGDGNSWSQNSSYKNKGGQKFNSQALDKWKYTLDERITNFIEKFCFFEMELLNYEFSTDGVFDDDEGLLDYEDDLTKCSEWIQPYAGYDNFKEVAIELTRVSLLKNKAHLSENICKLILLNPDLKSHFDKLQ